MTFKKLIEERYKHLDTLRLSEATHNRWWVLPSGGYALSLGLDGGTCFCYHGPHLQMTLHRWPSPGTVMPLVHLRTYEPIPTLEDVHSKIRSIVQFDKDMPQEDIDKIMDLVGITYKWITGEVKELPA